MELASPTVHGKGNNLHVSHGDDKGLFVTFYDESVEHPHKSEEAGYPIFVDVTYIQILFPGDNTRKTVRPAKLVADGGAPPDPQRWPAQWQAYKSQSEQVESGLPVTQWGPLTKSQALMLKSLSIHTVEQLAAVPDHALTWMGAREMQAKAQAFLRNAQDGAEVNRLQAENDALRADVDALKAQFQALSEQQRTQGAKRAGKDAS